MQFLSIKFQLKINWRDFTVGFITGIGFTRFWLLADGLLILTAIPFKNPPKSIWLISLAPLITIFWSLDPLASFMWFWRVHVLYASFSKIQNQKSVLLGILPLIILQIIIAFADDGTRSLGATDNPQRLGMVGWSLIGTHPALSLLGGLIVGLSGARLAIFIIFAVAMITQKRFIKIAFIIALVFSFWFTPDNRFGFESFSDSITNRSGLITSTGDANLAAHNVSGGRSELIGKAVLNEYGEYERPIKLFGYGFGSYSDYTGLVKPHNTLLLVFHELGIILPLLLIGLLVLLFQTHGKPLWLIGATLFYMFFVDDFFGLPIGLYVLTFQYWMISSRENEKYLKTKRKDLFCS